MNYLIARVSDVDQRKALPAQKKRLFDYAERKSWVEDKDFKYIEYDETAFKEGRKRFQELVIDVLVQEKEHAIVVFDKIDRFSRDSSSEERQALTRLFRQGRIEMHFPSDNLYIHKDSPASDLFRLDIGVALAGYYSSAIRDNVKRRFEQMLADQTWVGCAPIGYLNVNLGTLEKPVKDIHRDEQRAHHVVKMFEMRAIGLPYEEIAKLINAAGLRSKSGKLLNKSAVEKILRNPFYYGKMLYMGKLYPHKYERIIDYDLFLTCQNVRRDRHDRHTTYNSLEFSFKDFVRCKKCGCTVSSFVARNNVYLKCSGAKGKCGNTTTAEKLVMPDLVALINEVRVPEAAFQYIIDELKSRHGNQQTYYTQTIETTRKEYDQIKARLKALTLTHLHIANRLL